MNIESNPQKDELEMLKSVLKLSVNKSNSTKDESKNEEREEEFLLESMLSREDKQILAQYDQSWKNRLAKEDDDTAWRAFTIQQFGFIESPNFSNDIFKYEDVLPEENRKVRPRSSNDAKALQQGIQSLNPSSIPLPFTHREYSQMVNMTTSWSLWNNPNIVTILVDFIERELLNHQGMMNENLPRPIFNQLKQLAAAMKTWEVRDSSVSLKGYSSEEEWRKLTELLLKSTDPKFLSLVNNLSFPTAAITRQFFLTILTNIFMEYHLRRPIFPSNDALRIPDPFLSMKLGILKQSFALFEEIVPRYLELIDSIDESSASSNEQEKLLQTMNQLLLFVSQSSFEHFLDYMHGLNEELLTETQLPENEYDNEEGLDDIEIKKRKKLAKKKRQEKRLKSFVKFIKQDIPLSSIGVQLIQREPHPTITNLASFLSSSFTSSTLQDRTINWIPSSFSKELIGDFLYIHALLVNNMVDVVRMHCLPNYDPQKSKARGNTSERLYQSQFFSFFDCLPSEEDLLLLFDYLSNPTNSDLWSIRHLGDSLKQLYFTKKLQLVPSDTWKSSLLETDKTGILTDLGIVPVTIVRSQEQSYYLKEFFLSSSKEPSDTNQFISKIIEIREN